MQTAVIAAGPARLRVPIEVVSSATVDPVDAQQRAYSPGVAVTSPSAYEPLVEFPALTVTGALASMESAAPDLINIGSTVALSCFLSKASTRGVVGWLLPEPGPQKRGMKVYRISSTSGTGGGKKRGVGTL